MWTIERVKEELPEIPLLFRGKVVLAHPCGRKNAFATVRYEEMSWEFSWETLTHILNSKTPGKV